MFNNFFPENRDVCEIMCKHLVEPDRPQMTKWRMLIACWIYKIKDKNTEYLIRIAFPLQQRLHERTSMLRDSTFPVLWFTFYRMVSFNWSGNAARMYHYVRSSF
jgi:hypothetical protein